MQIINAVLRSESFAWQKKIFFLLPAVECVFEILQSMLNFDIIILASTLFFFVKILLLRISFGIYFFLLERLKNEGFL